MDRCQIRETETARQTGGVGTGEQRHPLDTGLCNLGSFTAAAGSCPGQARRSKTAQQKSSMEDTVQGAVVDPAFPSHSSFSLPERPRAVPGQAPRGKCPAAPATGVYLGGLLRGPAGTAIPGVHIEHHLLPQPSTVAPPAPWVILHKGRTL